MRAWSKPLFALSLLLLPAESGKDVLVLTLSGESLEKLRYTEQPRYYVNYNFTGERK